MKKNILSTQRFVLLFKLLINKNLFFINLSNFYLNSENFREYQQKLYECKREIDNFTKNVPQVL
jgi:hypothetical protein